MALNPTLKSNSDERFQHRRQLRHRRYLRLRHASRELKDSEVEKGATATVIAMDGIAIFVNLDNPVSALTAEQVRSIYVGETTNWRTCSIKINRWRAWMNTKNSLARKAQRDKKNQCVKGARILFLAPPASVSGVLLITFFCS
jgi:hypothetical protein